MNGLLVTVLLASLAGSLHCAGMCGPFVAFYAGGDRSRGARRGLPHLLYSLGRLAGYALLGALAGSVGAALDMAGERFAGVQRIALVVAGVLIIAWGLVTLLRVWGVNVPELLPAPQWVRRFVANAMKSFAHRPPVVKASLLGLLSVLLPCGWLYAFALSAAGTGSAWAGALVMTAFWAGTLPVMVGLGVGVQAVTGRLRRHAPAITAIALMLVGLWAVLGRMPVIGRAFADEGRVAPVNVEEAQDHAEHAGDEVPPCCQEDRD